jgi:hypothetical protein
MPVWKKKIDGISTSHFPAAIGSLMLLNNALRVSNHRQAKTTSKSAAPFSEILQFFQRNSGFTFI